MARIHEGANRASAEEAASFVDKADAFEQQREQQLHDLDVEFKKKKREINAKIDTEVNALLADAKKQGIKKGVIRALVNGQAGIRKAEVKLEAAQERARDGVDALEAEDRTYAVDIHAALGSDFASFGLGEAAVQRADDVGETEEGGGADPAAAAAQAAWDAADPAKQTEPAE